MILGKIKKSGMLRVEPDPLGEKHQRYFCAMQSLPFLGLKLFFTSELQSSLLVNLNLLSYFSRKFTQYPNLSLHIGCNKAS